MLKKCIPEYSDYYYYLGLFYIGSGSNVTITKSILNFKMRASIYLCKVLIEFITNQTCMHIFYIKLLIEIFFLSIVGEKM